MALTYGFFNSLNHDRMYSAEEMAGFLDGIVYDGVYEAVGNKFFVQAYDGMKVTVDSGRAWLNHTWTLNTTKYVLELPEADTVYDRIDAVVIEINKTDRRNYLKVIQGAPTASPQRPALIKTNLVTQYALAYITVPRYSTSVTQSNISYVVGSSETPLCSALALSGIPSGGKTGEVLAKASSESGAVNWYNINRLPSDNWYLPQGVTESDVIAAFKFRYAENETEALKSVNSKDNEHFLTKTSNKVIWNGIDGFYIPNEANQGLNNDFISGAPIGTVAVKYSNAESGSRQIGLIHYDNTHFLLAKYYGLVGERHEVYQDTPKNVYQDITRPVVASRDHEDSGFSGYTQTGHACYYSTSISLNTSNGILSCNFSNDTPALYFNGGEVTLTSARKKYESANGNGDGERWTDKYAAGAKNMDGPLIGNPEKNGAIYGSVNIQLVVFYNRILSSSEISSLHHLMMDV